MKIIFKYFMLMVSAFMVSISCNGRAESSQQKEERSMNGKCSSCSFHMQVRTTVSAM